MTAPSLLALAFLLFATPPGTIDTVAGTGEAGSSGDGGPATSARLREPFGCELDGRGHLFVADAADGRVRRVDLATGTITTVAGDSPERSVGTPYAVSVDEDGNLYVVDQKTPVVRKVEAATGKVAVIAGTGMKGYSGDNGPATSARLREPNDCCLDGRGGLLVADVADWRVRRVDLTTGVITTFAGTGKPAKLDRKWLGDHGKAVDAVVVGARAVASDGRGHTYICEREGNAIRAVDPDGSIFTYAGTGDAGYSGDGGITLEATFRGPKGVRVDLDRKVYVVDTENHAIRAIDPDTARVSTVAGGRKGPGGDGGPAPLAGLARPHGIAVAPDGTLYIADSENHRVRRVAPR